MEFSNVLNHKTPELISNMQRKTENSAKENETSIIHLCIVRNAIEPPGKGATNPEWAQRFHPLASHTSI
jgi:hypothetical protein